MYAQIEFDCSPTSKLTGDDLKNFEGIMFRHDHLRRNVKKIDHDQYIHEMVVMVALAPTHIY